VEKNRLEAFSDGVLAIVITIMVLELKVPHGSGLAELKPLIPIFLSYVISFTYIGIYWNNHHHLLKAAPCINAGIMWANLHLLFWLSLLPFVTGWMGENHFATIPSAAYGVVLLAAALAYKLLQSLVVCETGPGSSLAISLGQDWKGMMSPICCAIGAALSFVRPWLGGFIYAMVALLWLVPDRRIERIVGGNRHG
jgi:TMEM175 potassium channel family protein